MFFAASLYLVNENRPIFVLRNSELNHAVLGYLDESVLIERATYSNYLRYIPSTSELVSVETGCVWEHKRPKCHKVKCNFPDCSF